MDPGKKEGRGLDVRARGRFLTRQATASRRALPDFIMIGGMKCGTTSLFQYLQGHPGVAEVYVEEVHFFDLNYHRGLSWYRAHFPVREGGGDGPLCGDDSPYYIFHPLAAQRIRRDLPNVPLIVLLRDPVDRAYSHYHHERRRGREDLGFHEALEAEEGRLAGEEGRMVEDPSYASFEHQRHSYVSRGMYAEQLRRWFDLFPRDQFLVLQSEAMFRDPQPTFDRVLGFLGLPPMRLEDRRVHNPGSYAPMDEGVRERLSQRFRPHNEELFELIGERFDW
jgi:hypothetical protein